MQSVLGHQFLRIEGLPDPGLLAPNGTSHQDNPVLVLREPLRLNVAAHCGLPAPSAPIFREHPVHIQTIPSPGIYAVMTFPVLNRTLAIFLSPELGFLGFVVPTFRHTPFSSGRFFSCGDRSFRAPCDILPCRRTCINVHLCAREAGIGRVGRDGAALRRAQGCDIRGAVVENWRKTEGLTRRRRNVRGMAVVVLRWYVAGSKSSRSAMLDDVSNALQIPANDFLPRYNMHNPMSPKCYTTLLAGF